MDERGRTMQQRYRPRGQIQPKHHSAENWVAARPTARRQRPQDIKELVQFLSGFTMDELQEIPVVRPGARLEQGTYVELTDDDRTEFAALGTMVADRDRYFVARRETPVRYWNRLIRAQPRTRRT